MNSIGVDFKLKNIEIDKKNDSLRINNLSEKENIVINIKKKNIKENNSSLKQKNNTIFLLFYRIYHFCYWKIIFYCLI